MRIRLDSTGCRPNAGEIETMAFSSLHVFRFSARPGTPAAAMPGRLPSEGSRERSGRMLDLGARLEAAFHRRFVGSTAPVLWERRERGGSRTWSGVTDNFIPTVTETADDADLANRVTETLLLAATPGGLRGSVVGSPPAPTRPGSGI